MTEHDMLLAVQRQREALVAERNALREQVGALVEERDALRAENVRLDERVSHLTVERASLQTRNTELDAAARAADEWIHTVQPGPMTPEARAHCDSLVQVIDHTLRPKEVPHA
jgi:regulator of replication initiation timing